MERSGSGWRMDLWENAETYGMTLKQTHHLPLWTLSDLLLSAKQDFQQMSRHLKSHITTIYCFCDSFMICIREASAGLSKLSYTSTAISVMIFFPFILTQMLSSVIHHGFTNFHSVAHLIVIRDTPLPLLYIFLLRK